MIASDEWSKVWAIAHRIEKLSGDGFKEYDSVTGKFVKYTDAERLQQCLLETYKLQNLIETMQVKELKVGDKHVD